MPTTLINPNNVKPITISETITRKSKPDKTAKVAAKTQSQTRTKTSDDNGDNKKSKQRYVRPTTVSPNKRCKHCRAKGFLRKHGMSYSGVTRQRYFCLNCRRLSYE